MKEESAAAAAGGLAPRVLEKLIESRTILLTGEITSKLAGWTMAQLLALSAESDEDITIYLHSPGGHGESGDTIHDLIRFVTPRVKMIGTGWVASAGTHIYLAAEREDRFCLPNTRFMIHQPLGGVGGRRKGQNGSQNGDFRPSPAPALHKHRVPDHPNHKAFPPAHVLACQAQTTIKFEPHGPP